MKNSIIVALVSLVIMTNARVFMYAHAFLTGAIIFIPTLVISFLLIIIIFIGILKRNRLAWQWGRILSIISAIVLIRAAIVLSKYIGTQPFVLLVVVLVIIQGVSLFIMFFALGTTDSREYFKVICPECGERKVKAGDFLFSKVICRKCSKEWS